jgi:hypothetical protein
MPSVQAIRPQVHQRKKDQHRCGSMSLQTREEARTLSLKFALGQFGARAQHAVVRPRIVVGKAR